MQHHIKRIDFWDFDGTLMNSPLPEYGKLEWERIKGTKYPALGWWSKSYSLDLDVFDIQPNQELYNLFLNNKKDDSIMNILLTNRIPKLSNNINLILNKHSIEMDHLYFADAHHKGQRILNHLTKNSLPNLIEINVYDDMEEQIINLEEVRKQIELLGIEYIVHKIQNNDDAAGKPGTLQ